MTLKWPQNGPKTAQNGPKRPENGPKWSKTPFYDLYSLRSKMTKMAQNDPKMAQNSLKMAQNGPKRPKNGPKWGFMTFFWLGKKGQNLTKKVEKSRNLTKNGPFWTPKCPFSRKWPVFGPGGKNTRKHAFLPQIYTRNHFWWFWTFLRGFNFFFHFLDPCTRHGPQCAKVHFL